MFSSVCGCNYAQTGVLYGWRSKRCEYLIFLYQKQTLIICAMFMHDILCCVSLLLLVIIFLENAFWLICDKLQGIPDLSEYGDVYHLGFGLGKDKPPTSALMKMEFQREVFYHLCPNEVYKEYVWINSLLILISNQRKDEILLLYKLFL